MKIGMISYDIQDFGGLENYATDLAVGLHALGNPVSFVSLAWVSPQNQYARRLRDENLPIFQPPAWISRPVSDWPTKERIVKVLMQFLDPLALPIAVGLSFVKKIPLKQARISTFHWLRRQIMTRFVGPDYRKQLGRILLDLWNLRWHPDILHIQGYTTSLLFVIEWAKRRKIPVVYEEHQTPDPQFNWWKGFEGSINKADRVIAVSERSAQGLREVCRVTRPILVRSPLLPDPYFGGWKKGAQPDREKGITITTIARLYVTKGLMDLLETAALVRRSHSEVFFKVHGDGELYDELVKKAEDLGLDGKGIFVGPFHDREDLRQIMAETDIFFLPSILEGQPLAIVEAMAHGCPIVSTAVGGIPELIVDGENGLLCSPRDIKSMTEKLNQLIGDPGLCTRLSNAAREAYERSPFRPEAVAKYFNTVYMTVLQENGRVNGRVLAD